MSKLVQTVFGVPITNKIESLTDIPQLASLRTFEGYVTGEAIQKLAKYEDLGEPEELQRKNEWISVEDRLPTLDETGYTYVLVQMNDEFITATDYTRNEGFGLWKDSGKVTHWMPLPEPYKEEKA